MLTSVTLTVNAQQWQTIQGALNELPRKISQPVIEQLQAQVQKQLEADKIAAAIEIPGELQPNS